MRTEANLVQPNVSLARRLESTSLERWGQQPASNFLELLMRHHLRVKTVFVRAYDRFRLGKWEAVGQHWRSHPGQLSLF